MLSTGDPKWKVKGCQMTYHTKNKLKRVEVSILISENIGFRQDILTGKQENVKMTKRSMHQVYVRSIKIFTNKQAKNYIKGNT